MNMRIFCKTASLTILLSLYTFLSSGVAESFPFRTLAVGEQIPDATMVKTTDNSKLTIHQLKGTPVVLTFWGGDVEAKKKRSITALRELQALLPFFAAKNIAFKAINVQGDSDAIISEIVEAAGLTAPVYLDSDQQAYGALGIYIMPSVLLLDKEGRAVAGMGYSKDMTATLKGEIEILLGEKTRDQVEAELHPVMKDKSPEEKEAIRRLGMGHAMTAKGQLEAAEREYRAAIAVNPRLAEAHIELGCLLFQLAKIAEAQESLDTGLTLDSSSLRGEICAAQVAAAQGDVDTALEDLKAMLFRNGRNAELHYVLGTLYEKKANHTMAAAEFRKAYELLDRRGNFDE